jgi:hypothetical protein
MPAPVRRCVWRCSPFIARELTLPNAGVGRLQLRVRTGEFDAQTVSLGIPVR